MSGHLRRRLAPLVFSLAAASLPAQEIRWEPFEFATRSGVTVAGAELGHLTVPEDHAQPGGRRIELAMVRLPATTDAPGFPIVYLAGGPGGSGIDLARGGQWPLFDALRAFGDVIALDQRGAGLSLPSLECEGSIDVPLDSAPDRATLLEYYRAHLVACAEHARAADVDLAQYHTDASADDLEVLRQALGAEQLRLVSMSYGTHLALAMLRRHPGSVERVVMAGVEGPDHTLELPSSFETALDHVASLMAEDPATARVVPDFRGLVADVLARLERTPARVATVDPRSNEPAEVAIGAFDLRLLTCALISRRDAVPHLPRLFVPMASGDFSAIAPFVVRLRLDNAHLMGFAMDAASFASTGRLARIAAERDAALLRGAADFPLPELRDVLGVPALPEAARAPVRSNVPTLFISGTLDARTPIANAEEVQRGFPRSEHVIVEGAGHDDSLLVGAPEILECIAAFLRREGPPLTRIALPPITFSLPPASEQAATRVLLTGARVLDPSGTSWRDDHAVLVEGERIVRVGPSDEIDAAGAQRIDVTGKFVIPGLHDLHVHLSKVRRPALPLLVYHGVTTVRDLGGELEEVRAWQRAIRRGELIGPRIRTVGSYLEAPANIARMVRDNVVEPFERARIGVRDPEHAREVVRDLAARGVDGIKMRTFVDKPTYFAIGEAAAAVGLPFYAHATNLSPEDVLRSGQRSIEHGFLPPLAARPEAERRELCRAMAAQDVVLVPTIAAWSHSLLVPPDEVERVVAGTGAGRHGLRPLVSAFTLADWREQAAERTPAALRMIRGLRAHYFADIATMRAAGMTILPGSDLAVLLIQPGASLHDEIALFVSELGMSPAEALRSATRDAATFLGEQNDAGMIAPRMRADLVVLDADPLADIENVRAIHGVLVAGRWLGPTEREQLLATVRAMPELTENDWRHPERGD